MGGQTISTSETRLNALVLPSSAYGACVPLVGGVARVPTNIIDYLNFESHAHTEGQGGKGGVETQNTSYTYSVSLLLSVGHGRGYLGTTWKGKSVFQGGWAAANVLRRVDTYTPPGSGAMTKTLTNGSTRIGQPFVTCAGPQWTQILSEGDDYSVVGNVLTVLKNTWRTKPLSIAYQYGSGSYSHAGLTELGLTVAIGSIDQAVPAWIVADAPSHARNYPGMVYVHGQDYDLGNSASIEPHSFEMLGFGAYRYGSTKPDCNIAEFVGWLLTNDVIGAGLPSEAVEVQSWIDYCAAAGLLMSPALTTQMRAGDLLQKACELTNSRVVQSYDRIRVVPLCDVEVTGNGVTYTPDTTPQYDLTDDFMVGNPSFTRTLKLPEDRFNHVKIEFNDRANYYNKSIAEAYDDGDIALNGPRAKATVSAPWICDRTVARTVAQLLMQRDLNIAGGGNCRLPWAFCLLDVADLVSVLDPILADELTPLRITQLDEDEYGFLTCTLEDWPLGTASPTEYTTEVPGGYLHDYNADPGSVDAPIVVEGPAQLAGSTGIELWVGARGPDPDYGGCAVWVSYDGTEYKQMGTIYGNSRYGTLQNSVSAGATVFRVTGLGSKVELKSGSLDDAQNLETLCFVGGANPEFFAHQAVTLISSGTWDLNVPVRGAYDTDAIAHVAAVPFARLDAQLVRSDWLEPDLIGKTIHVKCLAFNKYGRAQQSLSDATDYTYTITGAQYGRLGVPYRVVSRGTSDTEGPVAGGLYDVRTGTLKAAGASTYKVVVINRASPYNIISSTTYNVGAGGANPGNMATALNALDNDVVLAIFGHGNPQPNRLLSGLDAAMYRIGASRAVFGSPQFKAQSSYILIGIPGIGEGAGAEMYNGDTDNSTNAWCDLYFEVGPHGFNCSGSTSTPRSLRDYSYTGDFDATAGTVLVPRGNCTKSGSTITKVGGSAAWDSDCYSADGFTGGAFCSGVPPQDDKDMMFGLNQDPTTNQSYTSIDWAFNLRLTGDLYIYEGGTSRGPFGTYAAGDVLAVVYDGYNVVYLQNGVVLRTVDKRPNDLKLYFDSSFHTPGGVLSNCQFGPMSGVNGIGTNQLLDGAATEIQTTEVEDETYTFPGTGVRQRVFAAVDVTNDDPFDINIEVSVSGQRFVTTPAGLVGTLDLWVSEVGVLNVTDNLLVSFPPGGQGIPQVENLGPSSTARAEDAVNGLITLPPGKTYRFTPTANAVISPGTTGSVTLRTTGYCMRIGKIKR